MERAYDSDDATKANSPSCLHWPAKKQRGSFADEYNPMGIGAVPGYGKSVNRITTISYYGYWMRGAGP